MKFSKGHTSATYDVSTTELRDILGNSIPPEFRTPGSNITLSFHDLLTGNRVSLELGSLKDTVQVTLRSEWQILPKEAKSGEEPT